MINDYTNFLILESLKIPLITDIYSLSEKLALSTKLIFLMSNNQKNYYNRFTIKKKSGGNREILSPKFSLKMVQRWILSEILEKISVSEQAMAYIKGQGSCIKRNANYHKNSLYIYEIDLKDFFNMISRKKVFYVFKRIGYNNVVSNILANLCTCDGHLPQGGVTSPTLSNIVCKKMDKRLDVLCSNRDIIYTRYADDLTFSCDNKVSLLKITNIVNDIIKDEGFMVNPHKTRLLSPSSHKSVTGITVNNSMIKANKKLKKGVRAKIHFMICNQDYRQKNHLRGLISFINSIEPDYEKKVRKYIASFYNKEVSRSKDVALAYNENKFFDDMKDMMIN